MFIEGDHFFYIHFLLEPDKRNPFSFMFFSCIPCAEPENSVRGVLTPDFLDQRTSPSQRAVCTSLEKLLEGVRVSLLLLEGVRARKPKTTSDFTG